MTSSPPAEDHPVNPVNRKRLANTIPEEFLKEIAPKRVAKSTSAATSTAVKNFLTFFGNLNLGILDVMEKTELKTKLMKFYSGCRTEKGEIYKVNSMHTIRNGLQRYFMNIRRFDIINDAYFQDCNKCFNDILSQIKASDKGSVTHHAEISPKDLLKLYNSFDLDSPLGLLEKVWLDIMFHFYRQGRDDLRSMTLNTFDVGQGTDGRKFIYKKTTTTNNETKTTPDNNPSSESPVTDADSKMYETGSSLCPFKTFFKYKSKLNRFQGSFWQRPRKTWLKSDDVWYENNPLGVNILGHMMTNLSQKYRLSTRYTNLCIHLTNARTFNDTIYKKNQDEDTVVYLWTGQLDKEGQLNKFIQQNMTPSSSDQGTSGNASNDISSKSPSQDKSDGSSSETSKDHQTSPSKSINDIPQHIWDILPSSANYLKELMLFTGYDTIPSVSRLDSKAEREKMIQFAIAVNEEMEVAHRKRVFGFFHKSPEKLMILPGVEIIFDEFIRSVKELKENSERHRSSSRSDSNRHDSTREGLNHGNSISSLESRCTSCSSLISESSESIINEPSLTADSVRQQILKLFSKLNNSAQFKVTEIPTDPNRFQYTCCECNWRTNITKDSDNRISLVSVQHHYRSNRCQGKSSRESIKDGSSDLQNEQASPKIESRFPDPDCIKIEIDEPNMFTDEEVFQRDEDSFDKPDNTEKEYFL